MFERALKTADIARELGVSEHVACRFLTRYGTMVGNVCTISQRRFREMQLSGEVAEWMKTCRKKRTQGEEARRLERAVEQVCE